jgi:glycosyltransferase involved in cell wall biosynthesis
MKKVQKQKKLTSLTIFFPCYNDEKSIGMMIKSAYKVGKKVADELEVVVVNDGSTDKSLEMVMAMGKKFPDLVVVDHPQNRGYGGALRSGFETATKEFVFYTDGDAQYKLEELPRLVDKMSENVDVVNGKIGRPRLSLRDMGGNLYRRFIRTFFNFPVSDVNVAFKLIRTSVVKDIDFNFTSGAFCPELIGRLNKKGARFEEVEVTHYERPYGKSQFFRFDRVSKTIIDDLKLFWQLKTRR